MVDDRVEHAIRWIDRHPGKPLQVSLSFFEKRFKQAWFSKQEERLYWEQWKLNLRIRALRQRATSTSGDPNDLQDHHDRQRQLQNLLRATITEILTHVNDKREHIPPVVSSEAVTFPYEITIASPDDNPSGLVTLKKLLTQTKAPQMLG